MPNLSNTPIKPALPDLAASARLIADSLGRAGPHALGCPPLALDLAAVAAPTAAGLGELVRLHARLREMGGRLVLVNVGPMAHEALAVTGLVGLLDVRPAACDATGRPGAAA